MKLEPRERKVFTAFEVDALKFILPKVKIPKAKKAKKAPAPAAKAAATLSRQASTGIVPLTRAESAKADKLFREGAISHKWQYKDDHGKWADYAKKASMEVERAYASWTVNPHIDVRSVQSGDWEYMVDFNQNTQTNIRHPNHKIREIRRVAA